MQYISVIFASVLLAAQFACTKKYQTLEGVSVQTGLLFNVVTGLASAVIMWGLSGFRLEWSAFSAALAFGMALCCAAYTLLSFQILKLGGMALYSTFLMSGGMLMPYVFGILFLEETVTPLGILGLIMVLAAVILTNTGRQAVNRKLLLLCSAVFLLNGAVSILSKCHQISSGFPTVSSAAFVSYTGIGRCVLCAAALLVYRNRGPCLSIKHKLSVWAAIGSAIIGAVSYLLQLNGASVLPASVLYPLITSGSIVFSSVAGRVFFKERISRRQVFCIGLCVIGALLLF